MVNLQQTSSQPGALSRREPPNLRAIAQQPTGPEQVLQDLELAARNHALPLEALRYPVTPVGLHYVLTHYDIPVVDAARWRLRVQGGVRRELELSLGDIRSLPFVRVPVTMECAGNGRALLEPRAPGQPWMREAVGTAEWGGAPLAGVLDQAGIQTGAQEVVFTGLDRGVEEGVEQNFERSLSLEDAVREEVLLAYEMNGQPLPPQHGFPLRLVVPGWYGMASVKWLDRITLVDHPFEGYQQRQAYRLRQLEEEEGEPLNRMQPRALMAPPGIPELLSRQRFLPRAPCLVEGRAWSGHGPITRVRVSTDGGATWNDAELGSPTSRWSWIAWSYLWEPDADGEYELVCSAGDAGRNEQPLEGAWNLGGYANNAAQRVPVTVGRPPGRLTSTAALPRPPSNPAI